ncbi:hypothetical protein J6590_014962 [Homalodisca vitripennis]|nr:hypothetical protein J6590_014962 [Homalodisca vitripennis]
MQENRYRMGYVERILYGTSRRKKQTVRCIKATKPVLSIIQFFSLGMTQRIARYVSTGSGDLNQELKDCLKA